VHGGLALGVGLQPRSAIGQHEQQPGSRHDPLDGRPGQVRQEKTQLNGRTRA
jgi:hypothetical protein